MKTRPKLGRITLAGLGIILCFSDFASAADSSKTVSTYNQRTGAVTGQLTATFGNQVVYGWGETVTLTPLSGGQATTTKTNEGGRFLSRMCQPVNTNFALNSSGTRPTLTPMMTELAIGCTSLILGR